MMAVIPTQAPQDVQGELPQRSFEAPLQTQAAVENLFGKIQDAGDIFFKSEQDSQYSKALSQASMDLNDQIQQQYIKAQEPDPKTGQPGYSSLVQNVSNIISNVKSAALSNTTDPMVANRLSIAFDSLAVAHTANALTTARKMQLNYAKSSLKDLLDKQSTLMSTAPTDQLAQTYATQMNDAVGKAVKSGLILPGDGDVLKRAAISKGNIARLRYMMTNQSGGVQAALDDINKNSVYYQSLGINVLGMKNEAMRQGVINQKYIMAAYSAQKTDLTNLTKTVTSQIMQGIPIRSDILDNFQNNEIKGTPLEGEYNNFIAKVAPLQQFALSSPEDQSKILNNLRSSASTAQDYEYLTKFNAINQSIQKSLSADPYSFAVKQGFIPQVQPIDYNNLSDLKGTIAQRDLYAKKASAHYGVDVLPISSTELNKLNTTLSNSGYQQSTQILSAINGGAGADALNVYKKMAKNGAPLYAYVGNKMAQGDKATASKILEGMDLLKNAPQLGDQFSTSLSQVTNVPIYAAPQQLNAVLSAAKAIYALNIRNEGSTFSQSGSDTSKVQDALDQVTNGSIKFGGNYIEAPAKDMSSSTFNDFVNSLTLKDVEAAGGIVGVKTQDDLNLMKDNMSLLSMGNGRYVVQTYHRSAGTYSPLLAADSSINGSRAFILDYNKTLQERANPTIHPKFPAMPKTVTDIGSMDTLADYLSSNDNSNQQSLTDNLGG